nr:hypothetical protein [uncultured Desulfobulbus sp.]
MKGIEYFGLSRKCRFRIHQEKQRVVCLMRVKNEKAAGSHCLCLKKHALTFFQIDQKMSEIVIVSDAVVPAVWGSVKKEAWSACSVKGTQA